MIVRRFRYYCSAGFKNFSFFFCLLKESHEFIVILAIYEENYVFNSFLPLNKKEKYNKIATNIDECRTEAQNDCSIKFNLLKFLKFQTKSIK